MSVATFTKSGTKASAPAKLDKNVFGLKPKNHQLLKDAYLTYQAAGRQNLAKAKTRGEVRGSTQKPWRQKGTGNARFGSKYNPIWRGGGVAFGPTGSENFNRKLSTKAKRQAVKQALSLAAESDKIMVIEAVASTDGKVKPALNLLKKLGVQGNILMVIEAKDELIERATRNIRSVKTLSANNLNVFDVLNADHIVITKKALESISQRLGGKNE